MILPEYQPIVHENPHWEVINIEHISPRKNYDKASLIEVRILDVEGKKLTTPVWVRFDLPDPVGMAMERPLLYCLARDGWAAWDYGHRALWCSIAITDFRGFLEADPCIVSNIRTDWWDLEEYVWYMGIKRKEALRPGEHWWIITVKKRYS